MNHSTAAFVTGRTFFADFSLARAALCGALCALLLAAPPSRAAEDAGEMPIEKVNLNTAGSDALQYIPGIGPGKAADIIQAREQKGGFVHIEELLEVHGIGEQILLAIKKYGTLDGGVSELSEAMLQNPPSMPAMPGAHAEDG